MNYAIIVNPNSGKKKSIEIHKYHWHSYLVYVLFFFKFLVLECAIVTVQDSFSNNWAIGLPTMLDLPMTTAFLPTKSRFKPCSVFCGAR